MKKLFWSAYVVSLIILPGVVQAQTESVDDFLGLESEILPDLKGEQKFTAPDFHEKESWNVEPEKVAVDLPEPNKGQNYSIIPWSTLDPMEWLSIENWIIERSVKDEIPDWKVRLREADHKELVGKILKCSGSCHVYRGINRAQVQHLSRVREGDELTTDKNSVAWIFLMDGSLMRVSPESSVTLQEINVSKGEIFYLTRLNHGHIFWHPKTNQELKLDEAPETDSMSIPLLVRDANQEFFERAFFKYQKDRDHLTEVMTLEDRAIKEQFESINRFRKTENPLLLIPTKMMIVSPNATLISVNSSLDFVYLFGNKSYFKKRLENQPEISLHLRGYSTFESKPIGDLKWYEVAANGRAFEQMSDVPGNLQVLELLTRRIKTIELAREIWIQKFTLPMLATIQDARNMAKNYGYRVWGDDLEKRFSFLLEYTRRIETTNLKSLENLLTKVEGKGENLKKDLSDDLYRASLNDYLLGLKSRYDNKKMRVREMSDLQYYVWILKNGRL